MKPPKTVVERAKANGSIDRASLLLSAAYLLNSEASNLVEEAGDILRANGLLLGELKKTAEPKKSQKMNRSQISERDK